MCCWALGGGWRSASFLPRPSVDDEEEAESIEDMTVDSAGPKPNDKTWMKQWSWYEGDVNEYYNQVRSSG